ncbi:BACON domain-containing carbohydrate-binding protein [uncultured Parabacteroides sp.]|uniref:BACON domain-containing protein n=1 Tax=uncultured Parabacteroides sp. TaxID=512312 RepID=UPI00259BB122|nr:BACON domain-containing carbohydrate-binding protein [uncultured Parabacteroides sp.]
MKQMRGIRYKRWICMSAWLFLLFVGSCTQADVENGDISPHILKDVDAGFHLNVLASRAPVTRSITFTPEGTVDTDSLAVGDRERIGTRAPSVDEVQESKIAGLWVGQYDALTGTLLFNKYFASLTDNTVNIKLKQSREGAQSHVWFIANAGDLGEIGNEKKLKEHVLSYASTENGWPENNLCGMTGMWEGVVQEEGEKNITVELTRLLAKISFTYAIGGNGFSFTPTSVSLKSVSQKSQVDAPESQLADMTYTSYAGTADKNGATMYWYLPENMAGTVKTEYAVDLEKKKTGKGVTHATFIELTGTAVQGEVTYENVTFCFYPGSDKNNYDIVRNSHYTMNVTLVGIDVSDERITVGKIPPIEVTEGNMPAEKGGTKEVQITARPGQAWSFDLEEWLSAVIEGKEAGTGVTVSHQGPAKVSFQAVSSNPKAEERSVSFSVNVNNDPQTITITQEGSTLTKGNDISLDAASGSEGSSTCKVTKGLPWQAVMSGEDWWGWSDSNPVSSGDESDGVESPLKVKSLSSNPLAQERTGKITVAAGASFSDPTYPGLKGEIIVKQAGSTVEGSTVELEPVAASNQSSSFTATPGLAWAAKVTRGDWLTLTCSTSGSPTTGSAQDITFAATVNPTASLRSGEITVRAGNETGGPTGVIVINQKASSLTASGDKTILAATADDKGTLTFQATKGLPLSITKPDWLTLTATPPENTTGEEQTLEYTTSLNINSTENTGNISVTAGEMNQSVTVKQVASSFSVTGPVDKIAAAGGSTTGFVTATTGLPWTISPVTDNGITVDPVSGTGDRTLTFSGTANTGSGRTGTFTVSVTNAIPVRTATITVIQATKETDACIDNLQVCKTDETSSNWGTANTNCINLEKEGKKDWRLPSKDELLKMYENKDLLQNVSGFHAFDGSMYYWSSTVYEPGVRWVVGLQEGKSNNRTSGNEIYNVRCVRDK